jgi:site-specific recombinase XerD
MALSARHHVLVRRFIARLEAAAMIDEDALVAGFLAWAARNSTHTADAYQRDLCGFRAVLDRRGTRLLEARADDVDVFVVELDAQRPRLKATAINRKLMVIRSAYRYFADRYPDLGLPNPVLRRHVRRAEQRLPRPVPDDVLARLIEGIDHLRDRALLLMYLETGLRLRALLRLNIGDVRFEERPNAAGNAVFLGSITALDKGGKERVVYFTERALTALRAYLDTRKVTTDSPLFLNADGDRLGARGAETRIASWCVKLGVPPIQVHQLRHL